MTYQLKGKRAKQILLLFDESENWYSVYLRDKIQQFLFWYAEPNNILWMQFLSGAKLKSNQRDEGGRRQSIKSVMMQAEFFYPNEKSYLHAWFALTKSKQNYTNMGIIAYRNPSNCQTCLVKVQPITDWYLPNLTDRIEEKPLQKTTLQHISKKMQKTFQKLHFLERWQAQFELDDSQIKKFWKNLNKLRLEDPENVDEIWLFNLGLRNNIYNDTQNISTSYTEVPYCILCLNQGKPEEVEHVYRECEITQQIWLLVGFTGQIQWKYIMAPDPIHMQLYKQTNSFLKIVFQLRIHRRYQENQIIPLTRSQLKAWVQQAKE